MNPSAHLTAAEFDRLLACLRRAMRAPNPSKFSPGPEMPDGVDWARFVQAARWHGVAPMLGQSQVGVPPPAELPANAQETLNEAHHANVRRVRLLGTELVAMVVRLHVSGVAALPFKGPLLAAQFYPEMWSRGCGNLDLIVAPTSLRAAGEALGREGYRFAPCSGMMSETAQWHVERNVRFRHPEKDVEVCLHAQIVPRRYDYRFDFERLWQRARVVSLPGGRLTSMSPEDWLLVLCLHAIKNGFWPRLKLACDLARVIAEPADLNWDYVREESRRLGCERVVLLGLALAGSLLGSTLPPDWAEAIGTDPVVLKIAARVRGRLSRGETGFTTLMEATRTHAALRRHPIDKFRYALAVMTTPSERDFQFLGRSVSVPGSYAVRGVKLAGKCAGQAFGRFMPAARRAESVAALGHSL